MDIAALGFEIDSTPARTAAKDLDRLAAAADKTERSALKLSGASRDLLRDESGRFMSAAQAAGKYGDEIEQLRLKYNPLYAASKQFEAQQGELQRALALGAISVGQYENALATLQAGMVRSGGAADQFGQQMRNTGGYASNMMFQFQDIGMMLAAGQSPLMLAVQQGSQVVGIFEQMKGSGQSVGGVLKSAFMGLISPTSLLTMGVIAGGAALVQWGMSAMGATENAQTFHDAVDKLETRVDELNESVGLLAVDNYDKMLEKYGTLNQAVYDNVQMIAGLNAQLISISQISLDGLFSENFGGYLTTRVDEMRIAFETTNDQAGHLVMLMNEVAAARGPDQLISSMTKLRDEMIDTAGGVNNLTTKQAEFVLEIERSIQKAIIAKNRLHEMEAAAPDGTWMNPAIGGIDALIARANAAINRVTALRVTASAGANGAAPELPGVKPLEGGTATIDMSRFNIPSDSDGGGGGGGGVGGGSDPYADNLNRLIESLQTEREVVDAWYNENLTILNDRRALEIMGETAHKDALLDLEREYQEKLASQRSKRLSETAGFFGELANIASVGGQKSAKAVATFQAIEGTINAYGAAIKALNTPGISIAGRFAAYASVLGAGLKGVAAIKAAGGGSGGGGGGASGSASAPSVSTAPAQPEKVTRIELAGEDWIVNLVEPMIDQIYKASGNGRVIVARG